MKVLIEIDDAKYRENGLAAVADPSSNAKVVGTDKDLTLQSLFSKDDVWELICNPHDEVEPFFSEDKIDAIDRYGRDLFLKSVIALLNNYVVDREQGISWDTVWHFAKDAYELEEQGILGRLVSESGILELMRRNVENCQTGDAKDSSSSIVDYMKHYILNSSISDKERVALWETHGWGGRLSCNYPLIRDAFKALRTGEISNKLRAVLYDEIMIRLGNEQFEREAHGGAGSYEPARNPTDDDIFEYIVKEVKAADDAISYYREHPTDTNAKYFAKKLAQCTYASEEPVEATDIRPARETQKSPELPKDYLLDGLNKALERYVEVPSKGGACGAWFVEKIGFDERNFSVSYDGEELVKFGLVRTMGGSDYLSERFSQSLSDKSYKDIVSCVNSVMLHPYNIPKHEHYSLAARQADR